MKIKDDAGRKLRSATAGRAKWKQCVAEHQGTIRYLRVRVRDLEQSRAFWKQRAGKTNQVQDGPCAVSAIELNVIEQPTILVAAAAAQVDPCSVGEF